MKHLISLLRPQEKADLPLTELYTKLGQDRYENCNSSKEFYFDHQIAGTFHENLYSNHSCVLLFWYGIRLAKTMNWNLCKGNQSYLYNDVWANRVFSKTIDSMPTLLCNNIKVTFGPVHTKGILFSGNLQFILGFQ